MIKTLGELKNFRYKTILFAIPSWFVWTICLLIYWPGMMSHDSMSQWRQIASNDIVDYQPALHTILMWIVTRISFSPSIVAITQVLFLGLSSGWVLKNIYKWGVDFKWVYLTSWLIALSPINMIMAITIWKDIPYTIVFVTITGLMFQLVLKKSSYKLNDKYYIFITGLIFSLAALFRWNGLAVSLSCLFMILICTKRWRPSLYIFSITMIVIFFVRGPIFSMLNIKTSEYIFYTLPLHHMGAFLSNEVDFSEKEIEFLDKIAPTESLWDYDCHVINNAFGTTLGVDQIYNKDFLIKNGNRFLSIYFDKLIKNPLIYFNHLKCSSKFIWHPWAKMKRMPLKTVEGIKWIPYENEFGITSASKISSLVLPVTKYIKKTIFIWKPAIFLIVSVFTFGACLYLYRDKFIFLLFIPIISQTIGIALLTNSQEFRYQYPVIFVGHFIWLLVLRSKELKLNE